VEAENCDKVKIMCMCRIPELSPEHAAREVVSAVRHNKDTVSVPHNLLFWLNVVGYVK
jgi:hypothetical protein